MSRIKEAMFDEIERKFAELYPTTPGHKAEGTSRAAAVAVALAVTGGRNQVLEAISFKPRTPDEVADVLGRSVLYVRPRVSELFRLGLIERTGERRTNSSGLKADV